MLRHKRMRFNRKIVRYAPSIAEWQIALFKKRLRLAAQKFNYELTDKTVVEVEKSNIWCFQDHGSPLARRAEIETILDPLNINYFDVQSRLLEPMAHRQPELVEKIILLRLGERFSQAVRVTVGSHTTNVYDADGLVATFFGTGRKMHGSETWRAWNVAFVLTRLGIRFDSTLIAIRDMSPTGYEPLIFEMVDGEWLSYEDAAVPG